MTYKTQICTRLNSWICFWYLNKHFNA